MTRYSHTCDGTGEVLTTNAPGGSTQWNAVTKSGAGSVQFDTAVKLTGTSSIRFSGATNETAYTRFSVELSDQVAVRFYFRYEALPGGSPTIMALQGAGSVKVAGIALTSTRYLAVSDSANANTNSTGQLELATWYRIEAVLDRTLATFRMRVYEGHTSDLVMEVVPATFNVGTLQVDRVVFGKFNNPSLTCWADSTAVETNSTVEIGPVASATASYQLSQVYPENSSTPIWRVDTTASVGTVSFTQVSGVTAEMAQGPAGIWSITPPKGHDDLVFRVLADAGGAPDERLLTIFRSAAPVKNRWTFQGGSPGDIKNWA